MKHWSVVLLLSVVACFGVAALAEATATDSAAVAQTDAAVQSVSETEVEAAAAAEVEAAAEAEAESDSEAEAEIESEAGAESEAEGSASTESQADLDAAHENAVATLEQYAEKAHELRDEIIGAEHSLMEQMSAIDSCPPSELSALMARAKKQITHLFQIKALYLAIKQQQKQLQALVDAGTGKRVPSVAPRRPAPKAKPFAKPAQKAAPSAPTNVLGLAAMNAKLVNALARLESVTARLAKVERRTTKHRKATMVIASQMEKDEKRLNKHSRVLRRVRSGQKKIRASLKRLAASCKRGRAAESRLSKRSSKKARKAIRKARAAGKKRAAKKSGRRQRRASARKGKKAAKKGKKKAFDVRACWARCAKARTMRQQHCVRVCSRKAKWSAKAAAKKGKRSRSRKIHKKSHARGRKARRSPALKKCLAKCRKTNPVAKRAAAKKCAVSCFRRHMHRSVRSRKGKKGVAKRAFNLKGCLSRCPRSKKNAKRRSRRCTQRCYAAARAARRGRKGVAKKSNAALKKCFKTCRKGKKWDRKCVSACRARHGAKKAKRAAWSPKALKACFKTCRGRPRIVKRRNRYGKLRPVRVAGKWNKACVASCRKRFGKPKSLKRKQRRAVRARKNRRINAALQKCYATCKIPAKKTRGGRKAGRGKARRVRWNQACVKRCRKLHGRKKAKLPLTAAYKACLKRCRPGKSYAKCKAACAKHNRRLRVPKVKSPSSKLVKAAIKGMKKKGKKAKKVRPETWEDVVRQSRRLLKKTVRLRDLVHKQVARHFDTNDVEGRKYNGWWSIYDILKGVKPGKHYTGRAKEIAADVRQIMAPVEAAAGTGKYGEVINSLKAADESFSSKFTREIGSPAFSLGSDPKFAGYVEKPLPGARIKHVPYNPLKPYESSQHTWHKTPPLSRLPELRDEDYDQNLSPIYARQFKITPRKAPAAEQPFDLRTKNWDYPQIPYSYPVTMVKHDPRFKNPHVRAPTPGFHTEWPEFRFQQTATSADAAAAAPAAAPAPAAAEPMKEGTN